MLAIKNLNLIICSNKTLLFQEFDISYKIYAYISTKLLTLTIKNLKLFLLNNYNIYL
jgi:hypothetical protein